MQSFNLLTLKLWICIGNIRMDRQLLRFEVYIVRYSVAFLHEVIPTLVYETDCDMDQFSYSIIS